MVAALTGRFSKGGRQRLGWLGGVTTERDRYRVRPIGRRKITDYSNAYTLYSLVRYRSTGGQQKFPSRSVRGRGTMKGSPHNGRMCGDLEWRGEGGLCVCRCWRF